MFRLAVLTILCAAMPAWAGSGLTYMCYSQQLQDLIVFKNSPCAEGFEAKQSPDAPRSGYNQQALERCEAEAHLMNATAKGNASAPAQAAKDRFDLVQIGMSAECVRQLAGNPVNINISNYGNGPSEQWVYRPGSGIRGHYFYVEGGRVRSIQLSR